MKLGRKDVRVVLIDTARSQLLGASFQGAGPGQGVGRVVAAVNVVVVQDGMLVGVGGRRTRAGGGRGHGARGLRRGLRRSDGPLGGPAGSPCRGQDVVDNITDVVAVVVGVVVVVVGGGQGGSLRRGRKGDSGSHRIRSDDVVGLLRNLVGLLGGVGGGFRLGLGSRGLGKGDIAPVGFIDPLVDIERRTPDSGSADGAKQQCRPHLVIN